MSSIFWRAGIASALSTPYSTVASRMSLDDGSQTCLALTALHNFIRLHSDDEKDDDSTLEEDEGQGTRKGGNLEDGQGAGALVMMELRDEIAEHM